MNEKQVHVGMENSKTKQDRNDTVQITGLQSKPGYTVGLVSEEQQIQCMALWR